MANTLIQFSAELLIKSILWLGRSLYRLKISGEDNIPTEGACILCVSHTSAIDGISRAFLLQSRADTYIFRALSDSRRSFLYGRTGIVSTSSAQRSGGLAFTLWSALQVLQEGHPIVIAPEREIRWDGRLQPFKPGTAWLALRSGAPIVICVLRGDYAIWPRWAQFPKLTGRLELRIGRPFSIPKVSGYKVNEAMIQKINRKIAEEMAKLERN